MWASFLTVQLVHVVRVRLVSRFDFELTFRTTGHDPWFDSIEKCQAHGLERYSERGGTPPRLCVSLRRIYAFIWRALIRREE